MQANTTREDSIVGCLLGTAVGDALGLPYEALSKRRQRRLYSAVDRHRFLFRRGMVSDDTEHTCMVAQALIVSAGEEQAYARSLAWRLRLWLLGLPAGVGVATLRALTKLWLGFPPERSGVFSAGNGPAMKSAILGASFGHDRWKCRQLVRMTARMTHADPKAEFGALAVALAAHLAGSSSHPTCSPQVYGKALQDLLGAGVAEGFLALIEKAARSAAAGQPTEDFAAELGLERGVSGYVYHTVPVALHCWFRHPTDYRAAVVEAIRCGGDTDTVAAIVGGIVGARVGKSGIPKEWLEGLWEWPRTVAWMESLARRLAAVSSEDNPQEALSVAWPGVLVRNVFFLLVVFLHGLRRLLPPY